MVLAAGGVRWWYDARVAKYERQRLVTERLGGAGATALWTYVGPTQWNLGTSLDGPAFRRPTHVYCDNVATDAFAGVAGHFAEIEVSTLMLLGRQIMPHARTGTADPVIEALRRHPTLRQVVVDASIRGTPAEFDAPIYTREDLALLEELLPELEIVWVEAN